MTKSQYASRFPQTSKNLQKIDKEVQISLFHTENNQLILSLFESSRRLPKRRGFFIGKRRENRRRQDRFSLRKTGTPFCFMRIGCFFPAIGFLRTETDGDNLPRLKEQYRAAVPGRCRRQSPVPINCHGRAEDIGREKSMQKCKETGGSVLSAGDACNKKCRVAAAEIWEEESCRGRYLFPAQKNALPAG